MGQPAELLLSPGSVKSAQLAEAAVTAAKMAGGAFSLVSIDGQNEAVAPNYNLSGFTSASKVFGCMVFATKASIATCVVRPASDYTAITDNIQVSAGAVDNTNNQCIFFVAA